MNKMNEEIHIEGAENMTPEELKKAISNEKRKRTRELNKAKKKAEQQASIAEEVATTIDIDSILDIEKKTKSPLSFNQNKNVAEVLKDLAKAKDVKTSVVLNTILESIVDVEAGVCKVSIEEEKQEKVQNTFKVDSKVLEVLRTEASKRKMSVNDYLNKVLELVLNLK